MYGWAPEVKTYNLQTCFPSILTSDVLHLSGIVLVQSSGGFDFTYMTVTPGLLVQVTLLVEIASVVNTVLPMW